MKKDKQKEKEKADVERQFPDMELQLILLLNAGLVPAAALARLCELNAESEEILYKRLCSIYEGCRQTNGSFPAEIYRYARELGSRDFMRFASLLIQSSSRGTALAEKLEKERDHLWNSRLSAAKAEVKRAETKLSFPLIILLLSLIVISVAPALMQMQF